METNNQLTEMAANSCEVMTKHGEPFQIFNPVVLNKKVRKNQKYTISFEANRNISGDEIVSFLSIILPREIRL